MVDTTQLLRHLRTLDDMIVLTVSRCLLLDTLRSYQNYDLRGIDLCSTAKIIRIPAPRVPPLYLFHHLPHRFISSTFWTFSPLTVIPSESESDYTIKMAANVDSSISEVTGGCLCGSIQYTIHFSSDHPWPPKVRTSQLLSQSHAG